MLKEKQISNSIFSAVLKIEKIANLTVEEFEQGLALALKARVTKAAGLPTRYSVESLDCFAQLLVFQMPQRQIDSLSIPQITISITCCGLSTQILELFISRLERHILRQGG